MMKKLILSILSLCLSSVLYAQTNTEPDKAPTPNTPVIPSTYPPEAMPSPQNSNLITMPNNSNGNKTKEQKNTNY